MKELQYELLPYKRDKGLAAIRYLLMAWIIRARRSLGARHSVNTGSSSNIDRRILDVENDQSKRQ